MEGDTYIDRPFFFLKAHRCLKPDKDPMKRDTEYTVEEVFQIQLFSKVYTI